MMTKKQRKMPIGSAGRLPGSTWSGVRRPDKYGSARRPIWTRSRTVFGLRCASAIVPTQLATGVDDAWRRRLRIRDLERLKDEEVPYVRQALLKERLTHWRSELAGMPI